MCNVQCAMCNMQYAICNVQCAMCLDAKNIKDNKDRKLGNVTHSLTYSLTDRMAPREARPPPNKL